MSEKKACVPKLTGSDKEFGNFVIGGFGLPSAADGKTDEIASRLLLSQIDGLPLRQWSSNATPNAPAALQVAGADVADAGGKSDSDYAAVWTGTHGVYSSGSTLHYGGAHPQDRDRKYLSTNGGCFYIDMNHLEGCTGEARSSREHEAAWGALLRVARQAQTDANAMLPSRQRIVVLANNSDRAGNSYGGHQSFLMRRDAWDDMIQRRMYPNLFFLMAYQVSSIVFTGQGKVGAENGHGQVDYQISQRADFIETLVGPQTTYYRPIVNTRNEPLCGSKARSPGESPTTPADRYARLHVIFYDTTLAPTATYLMVGVMQVILGLIEAGRIDQRLVLDDPLAALHAWSHDPDLNTRMRLVSGDEVTAVQLQLRFAELAKSALADGLLQEAIPGVEHIVARWEDTLRKLHARSFDAVRGRIDWLMKRALLEGAIAERPGCTWRSPEIVHLDQVYASLDPDDGLFLAVQAAGLIESVSSEHEIERRIGSPPDDTRAWLRAMLLRAAGADRVACVNWDEIICLSVGEMSRPVRIELRDPLTGRCRETEDAFSSSRNFAELLLRLQRVGAIHLRPWVGAVVPAARSLLDGPDNTPRLN